MNMADSQKSDAENMQRNGGSSIRGAKKREYHLQDWQIMQLSCDKKHQMEVMDDARSKDMTGNPIIKAKPKLSLYDVEYKLDGMVVVPVDKNTGKSLDEKQLEVMNKQLGNLWLLHDED